ncbi:TPA: filamentous hemagglutinin N-terminal domain-containing protein [Campylobacter jejuni]|nr:filamentous hemagglutinin N-terminal domain-containing protein [Campylobacter jejuni]HEC2372202.1 filamentous hemagglutinin N-terminal domain-containing protein [Campylobacter jejuni]HEC2397988.1 filamentous hemagglutinin N-terminal domain-containing protein [Campylobacter jejuni]
MKKMSKHIVLSFAVSSLLFSQAYALPSGGKFTHGSTGSISSSNGTMNITGNKGAGSNGNNFVIQWGGGFNIAQGESVNFTTSGKNYLNIAYQKDASKIDGKLDGSTNNIFLVNPMGVLIGTNGSIIANKFVASTTALSDENVKTFLNQGANFSPIFNPNKQGNIVNLGTINADNIVLIGNKVEIGNGGRINGKDGINSNAKDVKLAGNYIYVTTSTKNGSATIKVDKDKLQGMALKEGYFQMSMTDFKNNNWAFNTNGGADKITAFNYTDSIGNTHVNKSSFERALTIGGYYKDSLQTSLNDNMNAKEWEIFAEGWNRQGITDSIFKDNLTTIRLISDIDFNDYHAIDPVGAVIAFSGKFDGGGYTLKNLTIKAQDTSTGWNTGIFGKVQGTNDKKAQIYNLIVDGLSFSGTTNSGGAFVAQSSDAEFNGIALKNIKQLSFLDQSKGSPDKIYAGGFVGWAQSGSEFKNILLSNFGGIIVKSDGKYSSKFANTYAGGFVGLSDGASFENIGLSNFGAINALTYQTGGDVYAGGFAGYAKGSSIFKNIDLSEIGGRQDISTHSENKDAYGYGIYAGYDKSIIGVHFLRQVGAGGFIGGAEGGASFQNISLYNIGDIESHKGSLAVGAISNNGFAAAGGFIGLIENSTSNQFSGNFSQIYMNFDKSSKIYAANGYTSIGGDGISSNTSEQNYAGGFLGGANGRFSNIFYISDIYYRFGSSVTINTRSSDGYYKWHRGVFSGNLDSSNYDTIYNIKIYYRIPSLGNPQYTGYYGDYYDKGKITYSNDNLNTDRLVVTYSGDLEKAIYQELFRKIIHKVNSDINQGKIGFYNSNYKVDKEIPNIKDPTAWSKNDFDPKLLQRILDDIFNGKYVYKLGDDWYIDLGNNQLVKWSEFIKNDGGKYSDNAIYQSINFLSSFEGSDIDKNFKDTWNNDSSQSYKDYTNLYNAYKNKFSTSNVDSKYEDYQETLNKYQEIIDSMNKILGDNSYTNRLQGLIDSIKNYNEASKALDAQINEFQKVANALQAQIDYYNKNFSQLDDETAYNQFIKLQAQIKDFTTKQSQLQAQQNALLAQFNKINSEKGALDQIYNDLLKGQANGNTDKAKLDQLKQALANLKLDSLVKDPDHSLSSIGKDADGKAFTGSYVFSGALKDPSKMPSFNKPTDDKYTQNDTSIPSVGGLEYEPDKPDIDDKPVNPDKPDKPDIDDKPTLPDQKPDEGGDNPNQGGDNTVDIDNDTSNVIYADNQGQDEEEDEEENKLGLDETQAQEKGVLCVVSDDFRTMNICAIK